MDEKVYNVIGSPSLFLPYLEMHGVIMIDYACNGGESRGGRDNNMHKFNCHTETWHGEHSETLVKLVNYHPEFLRQNE